MGERGWWLSCEWNTCELVVVRCGAVVCMHHEAAEAEHTLKLVHTLQKCGATREVRMYKARLCCKTAR
jgi:hypothetical protein